MLANQFGRLAPILLLLAALSCGGEYVVAGFGNGGNVIGGDAVDRVAQELAKAPSTPAVSDEDLRAVFAAIRADALEGDPKAALVLFLVAGEQRKEKD